MRTQKDDVRALSITELENGARFGELLSEVRGYGIKVAPYSEPEHSQGARMAYKPDLPERLFDNGIKMTITVDHSLLTFRFEVVDPARTVDIKFNAGKDRAKILESALTLFARNYKGSFFDFETGLQEYLKERFKRRRSATRLVSFRSNNGCKDRVGVTFFLEEPG